MGFKRCFKPPGIVSKPLNPIEVPGVRVGTSVHRSDLAYADDIVLLSSNYREMQDLLEAANNRSEHVYQRIEEQRQVFLLDSK